MGKGRVLLAIGAVLAALGVGIGVGFGIWGAEEPSENENQKPIVYIPGFGNIQGKKHGSIDDVELGYESYKFYYYDFFGQNNLCTTLFTL